MAKLFLSYDREDGETARSLAAALEQSGHKVWWDRHILGGAEYSEEIEQALDRADTVIVLWSKASVKSAWVRDEAAAQFHRAPDSYRRAQTEILRSVSTVVGKRPQRPALHPPGETDRADQLLAPEREMARLLQRSSAAL
ncbi:MAG: toll/interleukin-1 receptor domain-containing protein [Sphingomicrobium sp.]